ncbi:MAG: DUF5067 domain-containing protein, partial [Oscillospiraceae bacterium]|nr:DUF5067 domain-containing protein [Oscillospiraceae bacterium]
QGSEVSIKGIQLAKDKEGKDLVRVNLTVTNKGEDGSTAAFMTDVELFQDGVGLPYATYWDVKDNVLQLTYDDGTEAEYELSINGDKLVLIDTSFQEELTFARAD